MEKDSRISTLSDTDPKKVVVISPSSADRKSFCLADHCGSFYAFIVTMKRGDMLWISSLVPV